MLESNDVFLFCLDQLILKVNGSDLTELNTNKDKSNYTYFPLHPHLTLLIGKLGFNLNSIERQSSVILLKYFV